MSCPYQITLTKHPVDGLKLALRQQAAQEKRSLTIVISGGTGCALAYGFTTPNEYAGVVGLIHYAPSHLASEVEFEGATYPVIFPAGQGAGLSPYSEFLDRLRPRLHDWKSVSLVMEYPRIESDLPPLTGEDEITCFWEVRDLLTDAYVDQIDYLSERMANEGSTFRGLQLYCRGPAPENAAQRQREIETAARMAPARELVNV